MEFEFDPQKSQTNAQKHGIDFVDGQKLWDDPFLLILPSLFPDEARYVAIGQIGELYWAAIFTERADKTRIISIRRARYNERTLYEQNRLP